MKVLVTGATGFIGSCLVRHLANNGMSIIAASRNRPLDLPTGVEHVSTGDINGDTDWSTAICNVDVIVHTAGRAHVLSETATDPLMEFRQVNVAGTYRLATQAAEAGVRRLIFISSIGVCGNRSNHPLAERDPPSPAEPYAMSKYESEVQLRRLATGSNLEAVIIRPPLVYGPNAPGNFGMLVRLVRKGWPLPLGSIRNERSFIALKNLVDLITVCISHPAAANQTFHAADGEDVSTPELVRRLGRVYGKQIYLLPVPVSALMITAAVFGKSATLKRLTDSLRVDINKVRNVLGWIPPLSLNEGLEQLAGGIRDST